MTDKTDGLLALVLRYIGLAVEAGATWLKARALDLSEEEIAAEEQRILERERDDMQRDWDKVKS